MNAATTRAPGGGQYLTFTLGSEAFGIDILRVQELKGYSAVTPIPNAPAHVKGVMNLRGAVIGIIDLRERIGLPRAPYTKVTVTIVVTVGAKIAGLVVDSVSDVIDLQAPDLAPAPEFDASVDLSFVTGIGTIANQLVTLLDVDQIVGFGGDAAGAVESAS